MTKWQAIGIIKSGKYKEGNYLNFDWNISQIDWQKDFSHSIGVLCPFMDVDKEVNILPPWAVNVNEVLGLRFADGGVLRPSAVIRDSAGGFFCFLRQLAAERGEAYVYGFATHWT